MTGSNVVIIGGGPAGATLGCYLSLAGVPNTIIESAVHPRAHVGESMVTASIRIWKEIGFLDKLDSAGFVKKHGAAWHPPTGNASFTIRFDELSQKGVDRAFTYQVDRSKFDLLLLKHAESLGSTVLQGVQVQDVHVANGRAVAVRCRDADTNFDMDGSVVVDASGRHTLLGRKLGLKQRDPNFNQVAVHGWFRHVDRGNGLDRDYIHIYFLPVRRGWAWQIPISDEITSVGVVTEAQDLRDRASSIDEHFHKWVTSTPAIGKAMGGATLVDNLKSEGDYSYSMNRFAGDGWLLIGDAARFVDPIFSSGVSVAHLSAKYASEAIVAALEEGSTGDDMFAGYEKTLRSGVEVWYEFIRLYYKLIPAFTYFIQDQDYRLQILELLQGHVFDRAEVPVLDKMREFIESVEGAEGHLLGAHLEKGVVVERASDTEPSA